MFFLAAKWIFLNQNQFGSSKLSEFLWIFWWWPFTKGTDVTNLSLRRLEHSATYDKTQLYKWSCRQFWMKSLSFLKKTTDNDNEDKDETC